jgi:dihydrofolate synthase/folylpolyglutamate synthase
MNSKITESLRRLEISVNPVRTIVVAGTNGKGSVATTLAHLITSAGKKCGLFTSPHLVDIRERIRIDGIPVSAADFASIEAKVKSATQDLNLGYFETLTVMAALAFQETDWAVYEAGCGGTRDPVNSIPHGAAVITALALDHTHLLGGTIEEIAREKFGVAPPRGKVFHAPFPESVIPIQAEFASRNSSSWTECMPYSFETAGVPGSQRFFLKTKYGKVELALPGPRGAQNTALALTAFAGIGFDPRTAYDSIPKVSLQGRMSRLNDPKAHCPVWLSGDHNPAGIRSLLDLLPYFKGSTLRFLVGISENKDISGMLRPLFDLPNTEITLTRTPWKGIPIEGYGPWALKAKQAIADPWEAYERIRTEATRKDVIIVTGSLYLVGYLLEHLLTLSLKGRNLNTDGRP